MTIFSQLPQDMLQHEINHFLDPMSRMAWNEVLEKDEQVYKKFPVDYVIKHQICTSHTTYEAIATKLMFYLDKLPSGDSIRAAKKAAVFLKKFFAFLKNPLNHIAIMHVHGMKEQCMTMVEEWTEPDLELYNYLNIFVSRDIVLELRASANDTLKVIESILYVRKIVVNKNHMNIYG